MNKENIPEGWLLVPRTLTAEMYDAGYLCPMPAYLVHAGSRGPDAMRLLWEAILSVSPQYEKGVSVDKEWSCVPFEMTPEMAAFVLCGDPSTDYDDPLQYMWHELLEKAEQARQRQQLNKFVESQAVNIWEFVPSETSPRPKLSEALEMYLAAREDLASAALSSEVREMRKRSLQKAKDLLDWYTSSMSNAGRRIK